VNLVLGANGSGKSSLRDSILWILAGRCRSTDAAGRNADSLIRRGATECRVALDWEDEGRSFHVERSRNGAGSKGPKDPAAMPDLLQALLDMPHLLRLSAAERSKVLSAVISPAVPLQDVQRHAMELRVSEGALTALLSGLRGISPGPYGPPELAEAYKRCYDARTSKKRDLAAARATLQAMPGTPAVCKSVEDVRSTLETIEAVEASVREKIGALRQQQVEWSHAQARRQDLERQVAELEAPSRQPQQALPMERSVEHLAAQVARLRGAFNDAEEVSDQAREKRVSADAEAEAIGERAAQARSGDTSCPAGVTRDPCPVLQQRVEGSKAQVPELEAAARKAAAAAKKARAAEIVARAESQKARTALENTTIEWASVREAAARDQGSADASIDAIKAELDRIEEQFPAHAMSPVGDIESSKERLESVLARKEEAQNHLRDIEAIVRSAEERKKLEAESASLQGVVSILEELVPVLEPRGLPARLLADKIGPVEQRINEQLAVITGGEYRVAIRAERGIDLDVFRGGSNLALPPENLSMSERLRLGVALAQAVSILSGLRFLVIDEAEMLDPGNRGLLMRGIQALAGQIETTVILATAERPTAVTSDQLGVFWVADGTVVPVMAAEPAVVA